MTRLKPYSETSVKKVIQKVYYKESKLLSFSLDTLKLEISLKSNGDMKSAINQLYMYTYKHYGGVKSKSNKQAIYSISQFSQTSCSNDSICEEEEGIASTKDREFTLFHTLGKFLYNKSNLIDEIHFKGLILKQESQKL
jgi:DNA polymerase III delta prime subunit